MLLLNLEAHIDLVLDPSGAQMLCVQVKKVDWWTARSAVTQQCVLTPMMLELPAMLLVSYNYGVDEYNNLLEVFCVYM